MDNSDSIAELFDRLCDRVAAGENIDADWIGEHYPQFADEIDELLPTLQLLLEFGQSSGAANTSIKAPQPVFTGILGDYSLIRELGRGGMGVVYEAEQRSLGRRVALKILPFAALLNETQLERFRTEAAAAARLDHPGVVQVYSVGCERGIHYYAMQLIEGPSLADVIAELRRERSPGSESADTVVALQTDILTRDDDGGRFRAVARIGSEAAEALHYAHARGVLHRDIKPGNLLLDKSGHVWIADFGLARVEDERHVTRTGDILGTLRYMSPEQAAGERLDARSDIYSLGATLYELATLRPVFDGQNLRTLIKRVIAGDPLAPHKVDGRIPRSLSCVIAKATARQLDKRYQTAQEMSDDLRRFLDGEPVRARPATPLRRATTWPRRHRLASVAIIGLMLFVLLLPFSAHHYFQRAPDDFPTKGTNMNVSQTAKIAAAVAAVALTAGKPSKDPPPEPFDHILGQVQYGDEYGIVYRSFVLMPVQLP